MSSTADSIGEVWGELLHVEPTDDADFFEAGGHSLLAAQMIARLNRKLGVRIPLRLVFDRPRLGDLKIAVEQLVAEEGARAQDETP
jgi:acyl carrier protein